MGSLRVASSPERWKGVLCPSLPGPVLTRRAADAEIKRTYSMARSFGFELHLVSAEEAVKLCPIISPDSVFALQHQAISIAHFLVVV